VIQETSSGHIHLMILDHITISFHIGLSVSFRFMAVGYILYRSLNEYYAYPPRYKRSN